MSCRRRGVRSSARAPSSPRCVRSSDLQVELERRRGAPELAERLVLELAHPFPGDAEIGTELLEGLRRLPVEAVAALEHVAHPRLELRERGLELVVTGGVLRDRVG